MLRRAILPHFSEETRGGLIINVSSGAGVFTLPNAVALLRQQICAGRFFRKRWSYELASQKIGVKIVEPGGVISTNFGKRSGCRGSAEGDTCGLR